MRRSAWSLLGWFLAAGCDPGNTQYGYEGYAMADFFPFDGERSWTFSQDGGTQQLQALLNPEFEQSEADSTRIFTVAYSRTCPEGLEETCVPEEHPISSIRWSASSGDGVRVHGIAGEGGEQSFDPPIAFTDNRGSIGNVVSTVTGGATFTAHFEDIVSCPINYTDNWEQCVKIVVDDDDDATTPGNHPLHGEYYAVAGYNVVAMQLRDDSALWKLTNTTYVEAD
jgi:hypothetical protein